MKYALLILLLAGCTTVSDRVQLGNFTYSHQSVSISGADAVNIANTLTSPSLLNNPLFQSAGNCLLDWIFGGHD